MPVAKPQRIISETIEPPAIPTQFLKELPMYGEEEVLNEEKELSKIVDEYFDQRYADATKPFEETKQAIDKRFLQIEQDFERLADIDIEGDFTKRMQRIEAKLK